MGGTGRKRIAVAAAAEKIGERTQDELRLIDVDVVAGVRDLDQPCVRNFRGDLERALPGE